MDEDAVFISGVVDYHRLGNNACGIIRSGICDASDLMRHIADHEFSEMRGLNLVFVELEARAVRLGNRVVIFFHRDVEQPDIIEELSCFINAADDDDLFHVEEVEAEVFARLDLGENKHLKSGFFVV